jgi:hypothetical protein
MRRFVPSAVVASVALAAAATPALAARLAATGTAVPRGGTILLVGTGFAPPNEFCRTPVARIDGRRARVTGRVSDDVGGWALRVVASQAPGNHVATMSQACENGNTGAVTTTSARTRFRILR